MQHLRSRTLGAIGVSAALAMGLGIAATGFGASEQGVKTAGADLRVTLDRLLGEHAFLAGVATQKGFDGAKDFKQAAGALDRNSVALSKAITSVYGAEAGKAFLSQWRAHIGFFVNYTVGLATKDTKAQKKAAADLTGYTKSFGSFLGTATGLPPAAVTAELKTHVGHLANHITLYSKGKPAAAYAELQKAYAHMFSTGDVLAGAIVKQNPSKF
jgi:hypothetical protein